MLTSLKHLTQRINKIWSRTGPNLMKLNFFFLLRVILILVLHIVAFVFFFYVIFLSSIPILLFSVKFLIKTWDFFYSIVLPSVAILLALGVVFVQNPVNALLCLIGVFLSVIIFLLSLQVEFLALVFLIVYIGAIAILFLFVIMMFNLKEIASARSKTYISNLTTTGAFKTLVGIYIVLITYRTIIVLITRSIEHQTNTSLVLKHQSINLNYFITYVQHDINIFATMLYTHYWGLFLLCGLVLLSAMLGSIVLALSTTEEDTKKNPYFACR